MIGYETLLIAVIIGENIFCSDDKIEFENDQSFNCIFQAGDGYLAGLAARFASEFNLDEDDVLHQLEDLRSVLLKYIENELLILDQCFPISSHVKVHIF